MRIVKTWKNCVIVAVVAVVVASSPVPAGASHGMEGLPEPGMLPDNPAYPLKTFVENVGTFFTRGDVAKAERFAALAEKRLAEAVALAEKGDSKRADETIGRYEQNLGKSTEHAKRAAAGGDTTASDSALESVARATSKHQVVLAEVYSRVPEQAKPAILHAIEASSKGREHALQAVSRKNRDEVASRVAPSREEAERALGRLREKGVPVSGQETGRGPGRGRAEPGRPGGAGVPAEAAPDKAPDEGADQRPVGPPQGSAEEPAG